MSLWSPTSTFSTSKKKHLKRECVPAYIRAIYYLYIYIYLSCMFPPFLGVGFPDPKPTNLGWPSPAPPPTSSRPSSERGLNLPWRFGLGTRKQTCGVFVRGAWRKHTNHKQNHPKKSSKRSNPPILMTWRFWEIPLKCEAAARMQQCQHQDDILFFQLGEILSLKPFTCHWHPGRESDFHAMQTSKFLRKKNTKIHQTPPICHPSTSQNNTTDRLIGTFLFCKQCSIQITIQLSQIAKDSQCSGLSEGLKANLRRQRAALP